MNVPSAEAAHDAVQVNRIKQAGALYNRISTVDQDPVGKTQKSSCGTNADLHERDKAPCRPDIDGLLGAVKEGRLQIRARLLLLVRYRHGVRITEVISPKLHSDRFAKICARSGFFRCHDAHGI